jgi:hypothetical protein
MKKLATVLLALLFAAGIVTPVTSYFQHPSGNKVADAPNPPTQPPCMA